jgi:hypothetical protein
MSAGNLKDKSAATLLEFAALSSLILAVTCVWLSAALCRECVRSSPDGR